MFGHEIETVSHFFGQASDVPDDIAYLVGDNREQLFEWDSVPEVLLPFVGDFSGLSDETEDGIVDCRDATRSRLGIDGGSICCCLIDVEIHIGFGFLINC